jgi:predicted Zn-ribbon and HTH transcriptional regulator
MKLTARNYYSRKANMEYMSVSQFKSFEKCPAAAVAEIKGKYKREKSTALLVGSYVDAYFEGTQQALLKECSEILTKSGTLRAEYKQADEIIKRIERDKLFMQHLSGEKQKIMTGKIRGVPFKIKIDSYREDVAIDDLKIMADFKDGYSEEKGRVPWFEHWGYDLQGAAYQEIVRQNTGKKLPFYLDAATKEKITDIDIVELEEDLLAIALHRIENNIEMYDAMKHGIIEPTRCEKCEYCKQTKKLKEPTSSNDYYF